MQDSLNQELQRAILLSEQIAASEFDPVHIDSQIRQLEHSYEKGPSPEIRLQLLSRYILLTRYLPVANSRTAIELRVRFQDRFPEHFRSFMQMLKTQGGLSRWSGCLPCKYNLGHGCAKGLQPRRLPSRYLNRDFACSAFEEKA